MSSKSDEETSFTVTTHDSSTLVSLRCWDHITEQRMLHIYSGASCEEGGEGIVAVERVQ